MNRRRQIQTAAIIGALCGSFIAVIGMMESEEQVLGIFALAFAAFCVWLIVRIVNRRERWAKWMLGIAITPVLYVASFGPAAWLVSRPWPANGERGRVLLGPLWFQSVYFPVGRLIYAPTPWRWPLIRYAEWGMPQDHQIVAPGYLETEGVRALLQSRL